jgi:hypothetical protein
MYYVKTILDFFYCKIMNYWCYKYQLAGYPAIFNIRYPAGYPAN